jgi:hypothetical protein
MTLSGLEGFFAKRTQHDKSVLTMNNKR